jgi:uncharacterized protein (TIGR03382 family)
MKRPTIAATLALALASSAAHAVEIINLRSGQVGGLPGLVGQPDDIVTWRPGTPPGAPASGSAFTVTDFTMANTGAPAQVINPYTPFWTPGISDPLARWINFDGSFYNPDGTPGTGYGTSGSCLYAVPFTITTVGITSAMISLEFAVDDWLGDQPVGGANPAGLYVNGVSTGYDGGSYATPSFTTQNITAMVSTGTNYLYLYQRDAGVVVSGVIFSATITVLPSPGPIALGGLGLLALGRRRRR